jgi:hypothetical protein
METREKMKQYLEDCEISQVAVAELVGYTYMQFNKYMNRTNSVVSEENMNKRCERFLAADGRRLLEIQYALRNRAQNRTELHRQRAAILKKAKVQTAAKAIVPSVTINQ